MIVAPGTRPIAVPSVQDVSSPGAGGAGFADAIGAAIGQVESSGQAARTAAAALLGAGEGDVPAVALQVQRAELSLELFEQVRNKFVSAYQEIMKMPM